jgi:hypothetical protein
MPDLGAAGGVGRWCRICLRLDCKKGPNTDNGERLLADLSGAAGLIDSIGVRGVSTG